MRTLSRHEFLNRLTRWMLVAFMAFVALALGSKVVRGNACSTCPGKGICNGETDCSKF